MANLEKVIKDLEFDNENLIRQIQDEIDAIDGIQKDIRNKTTENSKLEEDIANSNTETKNLHDQFKQNKEITESLKSATSLQQRHGNDLKNNLSMKIDETEQEREKHEKVLEVYTDKWLRYEVEYEKHPLAKEIRKLKLNTANLDNEANMLNEKKEKLECMIKEFEKEQVAVRKEKNDAIESIIKLAEIKLKTRSLVEQIPTLSKEKQAICYQLQSKQNEFEELTKQKQLKNQVEHQPPWITKKQVDQDVKVNIQVMKTSDVKTSSVPSQPLICVPHPSISTPKLPMPRFQPNQDRFAKQLQLPKMPQLPKFQKFQSKVADASVQPRNVPTLPRMNFKPKSIEKEPDVTTPLHIYDDVAMETTYSIPLEQPSKDYFKEQSSGMDTEEDGAAAPKTPLSSYSFSPGAHAEQLKKLKQSPGDGYYRQSRPMFVNGDTTSLDAMVTQPSNDFANSFSCQNQFMGILQQGNDAQNISTEVPLNKQTEVSPSSFAFTHPSSSGNVSMTTNAFADVTDSSNAFNTRVHNASIETTPGSSFCLNGTADTQPSPSTGFNFDISNTDISPNAGNLNFGSSVDFAANQSDTFNFGITSPASSADFNSFQMASPNASGFNFDGNTSNSDVNSSVGGFNFGVTANDSPVGAFNFGAGGNTNTDSFNFSFGGNVTNPRDESSNNFAFSF